MIAAATAREMGCVASPLRPLHHPVPEGRVPVPVPVPKSIALRRKGTFDRIQELEGDRKMGSLLGYVLKLVSGRWRLLLHTIIIWLNTRNLIYGLQPSVCGGPGMSNANMPHRSMFIPELVDLLVRLPI